MIRKIKWGIISTATIAIEDVIPALLTSKFCDVQAIASRSIDSAKTVAKQFAIPKAYASYEELLNDEEIEAVYIPLPNHLHVEWAIKSLHAGKHVLLEKPVALTSQEAQTLLDESVKFPKLKIMEAFMYRHHPQWIKGKELVDNKTIGKLKTIQSSFSFFDDNPESIVNIKEYGGGSLMDIGCYPISLSRLLFNEEPKEIHASIEIHPEFKTDTLATVVMEFEEGSSSFFSSTLLPDNQQVEIFGTEGRIIFDIPFNPIANDQAKIFIYRDDKEEEILFEKCDQYTIQGDMFSLAILNDTSVPTPLIDAVENMRVIERIFKVAEYS